MGCLTDEIATLKSAKAKLTLINVSFALAYLSVAISSLTAFLHEGRQSTKIYKARLVLYAMKPRVELKLKRLKKEGILHNVQFTKWSTPIVPVVKANGRVQICGDYKITVNPQLQTEGYKLPGGQQLPKINLR